MKGKAVDQIAAAGFEEIFDEAEPAAVGADGYGAGTEDHQIWIDRLDGFVEIRHFVFDEVRAVGAKVRLIPRLIIFHVILEVFDNLFDAVQMSLGAVAEGDHQHALANSDRKADTVRDRWRYPPQAA